MSFPLDDTLSAIADASGRAVVEFGPTLLAHRWVVTLATVQATSTTQPLATLTGPAGANLGGTTAGHQDTTDLPAVVLTAGQKLTARWAGASPGARCTLSVYGTVEIKGR